MIQYPQVFQRPTSNIIMPWSPEALTNIPGAVSGGSWASATWPVANLAIGYYICLTETRPVDSMFCYNGTTAAANLDMGIYDSAGTKIVAKGSTAQAGTTTLQKLTLSATLQAGVVYGLWMATNNTTSTVRAYTGINAGTLRGLGLVQMATAFALPATITAAVLASNFLPFFGISFASTY